MAKSSEDSKYPALPQPEHEEPEAFDFRIEPVPHPIELFELSFPLPPQGTWRRQFEIRADVRFAYMDLEFSNVTVRVRSTGARLTSRCSGCSLLPHSLYGLSPLPSRTIVAVEEKQTAQIDASASAQVKAKAGGLQVFDANATIEAKTSGEAAVKVQRKGTREEEITRVTPRPHGAWEIAEPYKSGGYLDGDYLTSRGQYVETPSDDPADLPLATVAADDISSEIAVELTIDVQPRDLSFEYLDDAAEKGMSNWFRRKSVNAQAIARRLVELTQTKGQSHNQLGELRVSLGTATLRGVRRKLSERK